MFSRKRGGESWLLPEILKLLVQEKPLGLCWQRCQGALGTAMSGRGLCGSISATWPASVLPSLCPSCPSVLSLFFIPLYLYPSVVCPSVLVFCSSVHPSVLLVPLPSVPLSLPFILCSSIYPSVLVSLSSVSLSFIPSIFLSLCPFTLLPFLSFCPLSFVLHI